MRIPSVPERLVFFVGIGFSHGQANLMQPRAQMLPHTAERTNGD